MATESAAAGTPHVPEIGTVFDTIEHGRQQVMDVMWLGDVGATVYLRPEGGGIEWTVPLSGLARLIKL